MARKPTSAIGKSIAAKGEKMRFDGKGDRIIGGLQAAAGVGVAAIGNPIIGTVVAGAGAAYASKAHKQAKAGERTVSRAKAIDNLVSRAKTGNTMGAPKPNKSADAAPAERTKAYTDSKGRHYAKGRAITRNA